MGHGPESVTLTRAEHQSELAAGELIDDRYRVVARLGGGGMGVVYEVEHLRLRRPFALKLLRAELLADRELTARFDRETRAVATLHSDHVVSIVDSGALRDGRPYFVMERLLGRDLRQILAENSRLALGRTVGIGIDICLGLHAAHSAGLVHRDLKPENVFVTRGDDGRERCQLLDFGVVKLAEQDHTRPGALLGTARYMAPEQLTHDAQVGPAADLFALGVVLYRCLAGEHPFAADSLERVLFRVMNDTPAPLPEHVPAELAAQVLQALSKAPGQRPASALDFARALSRFAPEPRHLDGAVPWRGPSALADETLSTEPAASDAPARVSTTLPPRTAPARRLLPWLGAAALLVAATLTADRLLLGAGEAAAAPGRALTPLRLAQAERPASPPTVVAISTTTAAPEPAAPTVTSVAHPVRAASKGSAPPPPSASPASSVRAEPSAAGASLNWFDPRNPYGK